MIFTQYIVYFLAIPFFVLCFYLVQPLFLNLLSVFVKDKNKTFKQSDSNKSIACVITAYQQVEIVIPLINSILEQDYKNYIIYLVADDAKEKPELPQSDKLVCLFPSIKLGSKVKSIRYATENFKQAHDAIFILDPDNLVHSEALVIINQYLCVGFKAVQAQRTAKNMDSSMAIADSISEIYYNHMERDLLFRLGSSSTISGSGMAIETNIFKEILYGSEMEEMLKGIVLGEDKYFHTYLVRKNITIAYAKQALVYDEKVSTAEQVTRQRTRWMKAYLESISSLLQLLLSSMVRLNRNQLLFTITIIKPPLSILVLGSTLLGGVLSLLNPIYFLIYLISITLFGFNFMLVLYLNDAPKAVWITLFSLPKFVVAQLKSFLYLKQTKTDFLTTEKRNFANIKTLADKPKDNNNENRN